MKDIFKILGVFIGIVIFVALIGYGLGWFNVFSIKTVGKAKQNAEREVFEQTQSYVEGKRQEAIKMLKEYNDCEDIACKEGIEYIVAQSFANFDENKYLEGKVRDFVERCKY